MIIVLAIVLSVSVLLYSQIKVIRNMGNSVASYYAGESGIEKVLFYDKRVVPDPEDENSRGLCYMLDNSNPKYCAEDGDNKDDSIFCKEDSPKDFMSDNCDKDDCTDCTINFMTTFDGRTYDTEAVISNGIFSISSGGSFGGASRKVNITITPTQ